jgi:hypothetical protein
MPPPLAGGVAHGRPGNVSGSSGWRSTVLFPDQEAQIKFLRTMVDRYKGMEVVHETAIAIVFTDGGCAAKDKMCHALKIGEWVQRNIKYVNEGVETFQSPLRTLQYRFGDCDDFASLTCTLLESIGIPSQLVGLQWRGSFRHIFARAIVNGRIYPLDGTLDEPIADFTDPVMISTRRGDNPRVLAL